MPIRKSLKIPVKIAGNDKIVMDLKYKALRKIMNEARYLGNLAIRYYIAYDLEDVPRPSKKEKDGRVSLTPVDTVIYDNLSKKRKFMPAGSMATLARSFAKTAYKGTTKEAWSGKKSLPTFKSPILPIRSNESSLLSHNSEKHHNIQKFILQIGGLKSGDWLSDELIKDVAGDDLPPQYLSLSKSERELLLVSNFSHKDDGAIAIANRIAAKEYDFHDSKLCLGDKGLIAHISYSCPPSQHHLDQNVVCGVDLGVNVPAVCAVNNGPQREYIGEKNDIWAARSKFRAERRRKQKRLGHKTKKDKWGISKKEKRWVETYSHNITRKIINFCIKNNCGILHIEDLSDLRKS
jgi:hypothetical protein